MIKKGLDVTDTELITASREGDHQAFKQLVKRYEPQVARTVKAMLGDCPEAEDIGQETFIRFYHALDKFRGDSAVGTYLVRIAINLSLNELKRRKRRSLLFFRKPADQEFDVPDEKDEYRESDTRELVRQAIAGLAPHHRSVIVLRLMDGYSTAETAKILKIPVGTVLSRLLRAQQQLRILLKESGVHTVQKRTKKINARSGKIVKREKI